MQSTDECRALAGILSKELHLCQIGRGRPSVATSRSHAANPCEPSDMPLSSHGPEACSAATRPWFWPEKGSIRLRGVVDERQGRRNQRRSHSPPDGLVTLLTRPGRFYSGHLVDKARAILFRAEVTASGTQVEGLAAPKVLY